MILDQLPAHNRAWDVCIVGSGPVGMSMALECASLGQDVLLLESGGLNPSAHFDEASRASIAAESAHVPMEVAVCRSFGGTSWLWGGRCVPLDDIDFEPRSYVPNSGWPIAHDEIRRWYIRAGEYLQCGGADFERPPAELPAAFAGVSSVSLERWARDSRIALKHQPTINASTKITLCINSTAVDLEFDDSGGAVRGVRVATPRGSFVARAREIVLAAGGVETARFLLAVQRGRPELFGGLDGPLGRFYMGHISGKVADIVFHPAQKASDFNYVLDGGAYTRRRFTIDNAVQRSHQLLNTAFWPDNPPFHDPQHRNAALSAIFLALACPPIGRKLVAEGTRLYHVGPGPARFSSHLRNVLFGGIDGARDLASLAADRFLLKPRKPAPLLWNRVGRYALVYHCEQEPHAANRVTLADERDRHGVPRAAIALQYTEGEARRIIAAHECLDGALRTAGIAHIEYRYPRQELVERILSQAVDGYHQSGTVRMGNDPRSSVVDANLKIHGISNLFVASSAVFPTSGQANSTFPAVALGVRLAHHLYKRTPLEILPI